jgi:hypothetical protein
MPPHKSAQQIYERYIRSLPIAERLQLLAVVAHDLASESSHAELHKQQKHSIMELHGLGAHVWEAADPQDYVNKLRDEWDRGAITDEA